MRRGRQGISLVVLTILLGLLCLAAPHFLATLPTWNQIGPLLLFLGLLTLINAPFDWLSLGLTRLLLRLGLQRAGWWPVLLALADAALAAVFILGLTIAMVLGVQAFDTIAQAAGGEPILPLETLFNGIDAVPAAPELWWVYALLLTTLLPSAINLMIGGASLMRGIPWLNAFLLSFMPPGKPVQKVERLWIALALTLQMFAGFLAGIAAQIFIVVALILWLLPAIGINLLHLARAVAEANLPERLLF